MRERRMKVRRERREDGCISQPFESMRLAE